jgi:hypothetical protein
VDVGDRGGMRCNAHPTVRCRPLMDSLRNHNCKLFVISVQARRVVLRKPLRLSLTSASSFLSARTARVRRCGRTWAALVVRDAVRTAMVERRACMIVAAVVYWGVAWMSWCM